MKTWLDLHMHSAFSSDGELSPSELVKKCAETNLTTIAVTDHNCIRGVEEAKSTAKTLGMDFFTGIEIDCTFREGYLEQNVHLLGYGINPADENFLRLESEVRKQEIETSRKLLQKIHELEFKFDDMQILAQSHNGLIVADLIGEAVLQDPRNDGDERLKDFRPGGMKSNDPSINFYWEFCSLGKPAFVQMNYISFEDAINLVKNSGGVAVLAYPGVSLGQNRELTEKLIKCGLDGLEVFSTHHDSDMRNCYSSIAEDFNLIATSGSDFHGATKPAIQLGKISNPNPKIVVERLKSIIRERGGIL